MKEEPGSESENVSKMEKRSKIMNARIMEIIQMPKRLKFAIQICVVSKKKLKISSKIVTLTR